MYNNENRGAHYVWKQIARFILWVCCGYCKSCWWCNSTEKFLHEAQYAQSKKTLLQNWRLPWRNPTKQAIGWNRYTKLVVSIIKHISTQKNSAGTSEDCWLHLVEPQRRKTSEPMDCWRLGLWCGSYRRRCKKMQTRDRKRGSILFWIWNPQNFCPRALNEIFTWCEVIRCGGDFTYRGSSKKYEIDLPCPCYCLQFRLTAIPINRDANGNYVANNISPKA